MKIYIQREGLQLGPPYSVEEAKTYLTDGLLAPDDLAWCEGMAEWVPLENFIQGSTQTQSPPPDLLSKTATVVKAAELGTACFELALGFRDSYTELLQELQHSEMNGQKVDFGQVWVELICLGIFSVEYALEDTLKTGPLNMILESYHAHLKRLSIDGVPNFYEVLSKRFPIYENAVHARHPHGVASNVGETFSVFCGSQSNNRLTMTGSTLFNRIFDYIHQWIREIGVENISE